MIESGYGGPNRQTDRDDSIRRRLGPPFEYLVYFAGKDRPFRRSSRDEVRWLLRSSSDRLLKIIAVYSLRKGMKDVTTSFNRVRRPTAAELKQASEESSAVASIVGSQMGGSFRSKKVRDLYPRSARKRALDELPGEFP